MSTYMFKWSEGNIYHTALTTNKHANVFSGK